MSSSVQKIYITGVSGQPKIGTLRTAQKCYRTRIVVIAEIRNKLTRSEVPRQICIS